ncbi:FkbM family methyltransferase [Aurantibacillus circumpalustris]|uniref:FkbM family methyltransferase n=1 Tax=Aurantibacillus circumpalustris TaxID=3036359 RepID=UPI00295C03EF|nr:FkbM family methyltransferase [Aurantibacillus circumpalustris]
MFNSWLPITKIKILGAKVLYKITTLFVGKEKRIIERDGVKYEVELAEGIELSLFLFHKFQSHITKNSNLKIEKDYTILDIGANVGLMTLQFSKLASEGRVISFEPTFYALERLKRNLALNPEMTKNVTVINSFVSEKSSDNPNIIAYSSWKVNGEREANDHPVHWGTPKSTEGVKSISLNDFVANQKLEKIDFIKIDTDGHEYEVFKGADVAIGKFRPKIIFEIGLFLMEEKKINFEFYFNYFKALNYKLFDAKTNKEVNLSNYKKYIPQNGSTDLIAVPQ